VTHIADVFLESDFRASKFADQRVFFRHVFAEQDFALRPHWQKIFEEPTGACVCVCVCVCVM
jgi:hypothetical protein